MQKILSHSEMKGERSRGERGGERERKRGREREGERERVRVSE